MAAPNTRPHRQQPWPWNCQHHAMYNLFGDERFIAPDVNTESNPVLFHYWCRLLGYEFIPLYYDGTGAFPSPRFYWKEVFSLSERKKQLGKSFAFLVDVTSTSSDGAALMHTVSIVVSIGTTAANPSVEFVVHDSLLAEAVSYCLGEFLASSYSVAAAIWIVTRATTILDEQPRQPGQELPHVAPEVRAAYEAHQCQNSTRPQD